jgi:hypothetical protein
MARRATDEESNPHAIKVRDVQATLVGMDGPSRGRGMKESAIWRAIVESPLAGAYVTEAYSLAVDVVERADSVMANASPPPSGSSYIKVDHKLMAELVMLTGEAARLKALITDRPRGKKESAAQYEVRRGRTSWLSDELLRGLGISALHEAGVRNSIEHFDEYLDETALDASQQKLPLPVVVPLDFAVGRRSTLSQFPIQNERPNVHMLRVYIASERMFVNAGKEVNIRNLRNECRRIAKRLAPLVPQGESGERGSSMYVLTSATFKRE